MNIRMFNALMMEPTGIAISALPHIMPKIIIKLLYF